MASKMTRRTPFAALGLLSCLAGLARCSLFVDTDGLTGDSALDASSDGTSDTEIHDGAANDAVSDATAANDGATASEAGFPGCGTTHAVCDDFDMGAIGSRWTGQNSYSGGALQYVSDASVTAPKSLHVSGPITSSGAGAVLYDTFSRTVTSLHCEMMIQVRAANSEVFLVRFFGAPDSGIGDYYTSLSLGQASSQVILVTEFDGGNRYYHSDTPNLAPSEWTRVTLDMSPVDAGESVSVSVGGGAPVVHDFEAPVGSALDRIILGNHYSQDGFDLLYDDVLCDVTP